MVIHIEFDIKVTDQNGAVLQSIGNQYDKNVTSDGKQDVNTVLDIDFTDFLAEYLSSSGFFLREKLLKGYGSGKLKRQVPPKIIKNDIKLRKQDNDRITDDSIVDESIADETIADETIADETIQDLLEGMELEYKIRIGKNKVLIGKIPLKSDADNDPENENDTISVSIVAEEAALEGDTCIVESAVSQYEDVTNGTILSYRDEENSSFEATGSDEEIIDDDIVVDDEEINDFDSSDDENEQASNSPAIYRFLRYSMMKAIEKYEDNIFNVWYEDTSDMEPVIDE